MAGNEDSRCNIDKITEYPIGEYPKTLFVIYYNCTPDLVFKVRGKWGFINFSECLKKVPQESNKTKY